ncbi:Mob1/phocein family protein [Trichomonas vaginalis G3]|uniref:Mob1/phocein family protein n=1 Tax=Trichomonas vaginalis (strain ATCC PRA-98 / G3) TaxID=412133 RepID=A2EWW3_TRIV3|nr:hippo signaling [Trichomonas vaginalis G3]EAY02878.1 Mob1/phocein family protein [Trichomonas vaginalis G3]KAI5497392.1 hippo signaling [Trichomonas vaginalis G3]|eukprot:XP_001315101.1 Mob1/phocein family protein [Trichomonas vaginalis G3]
MPPKKKKSTKKAGTIGETILVSRDMTILTKKYDRLKKVTGVRLIDDYEPLLKPPEGMSLNDFLVVSAIDYLERVDKLYQVCSLFCTSETCPMFNAGPRYHYFWEDESTTDPVQLSPSEYLLKLITWSKRKLGDTKVFPKTDNAELGDEAQVVLQTIYRRTTRFLNHLYVCHFSSIKDNNIEPVINTLLVHYVLLALRYQMMDVTSIEMLKPVFDAMKIQIPGI